MLIGSRTVHDLRHFGLCDLERIDANDRDTLCMDGHHDVLCARAVHVEESLQHINDELHRRVVVIQHQDFVKRRSLGFRFALLHDADITITVEHVIIVLRARGGAVD